MCEILIYILCLRFSTSYSGKSITMSQELHNWSPFHSISVCQFSACCITIFNSAKVNLTIKVIKNTISCVFKCYVETWPSCSLGFWTCSPDDPSRWTLVWLFIPWILNMAELNISSLLTTIKSIVLLSCLSGVIPEAYHQADWHHKDNWFATLEVFKL